MQTKYNTDDLRICATREVIAPVQVHDEMPITEAAAQTTLEARADIHKILTGEDDRLLVVVGPCSIHDPKAAQ
jgi:3-deoxy-7-phosphoheptulonate synthase